jgi:pimeloyl-ACP methyl ester carboxylesterase
VSLLRRTVAVLAAIALIVGIAALLLEAGVTDVSLAELESRYATADSKFADIDGVRLHYMDQGQGPVVLLLHASFMSLRTWDSMAASLSDRYRVVRPDFLIAGLTGPEPNDAYSFDRNRELVMGLLDHLGIDSFALVGTSSGGIVAFNIAAMYPQRVERLVLINSAGMPRTAATNPNRRTLAGGIGNWFRARYISRAMTRENLDRNFIEPNEPPDWLVDMNYDLRRREGRHEAAASQMRNFKTGDPKTTLGRITAPTLIMWGLNNLTVVHLEADVFQHWLVNAPTAVKKYPGVGHYLYLENPVEVEADIASFMNGEMDGSLVRTVRHLGTDQPVASSGN